MNETTKLKSLAKGLDVDLFGVADLKRLKKLSTDGDPAGVLGRFRRAIVLGAQLNKLGAKAKGSDLDFFLETAALKLSAYLATKGDRSLIIHPEDEIDPVRRLGLLSLKVLAKEAGLGWQGRSLLIVSPEYGPVHRWIALLTNLELLPGEPLANHCGDCTLCIDTCPHRALKYVPFADHPGRREDVLDISLCKGDDMCKVCLVVCPWFKNSTAGS